MAMPINKRVLESHGFFMEYDYILLTVFFVEGRKWGFEGKDVDGHGKDRMICFG